MGFQKVALAVSEGRDPAPEPIPEPVSTCSDSRTELLMPPVRRKRQCWLCRGDTNSQKK